MKIEKRIKVPALKKSRGTRWPWAALKVGNSFFTRDPNAKYAAAMYKPRHPGWDYTCRRERNGFRIWRVA